MARIRRRSESSSRFSSIVPPSIRTHYVAFGLVCSTWLARAGFVPTLFGRYNYGCFMERRAFLRNFATSVAGVFGGAVVAPFMTTAALHPETSSLGKAIGKTTAVKDQGYCGSCWSFSAAEAIESAWAIRKGQLLTLSEQQLVDCSKKYGNMGCNGGLMDSAFHYVMDNGLCLEAVYPYTSGQSSQAGGKLFYEELVI